MSIVLSDYKLEVTIEQITPYVNYIETVDSNNSRNEIIRTTEFKPRFDRFLSDKLKIDNKSELLVPRESVDDLVKALDYKVIIKKIERMDYSKRIDSKSFQTSGEKYKVRKEGIKFKLIFFSFKSEVIKIIKNNLAEFLALTNFGKRKNKCYGSFYIVPEDPLYKDIDEIEILKDFNFFKEGKENRCYLEITLRSNKSISEKSFFGDMIPSLEVKRDDNRGNQPIILFRDEPEGKRKDTNGKSLARGESLISMKILKNGGKYRLYAVPNFPLLKEIYSKIYNEDIERFIEGIDEKSIEKNRISRSFKDVYFDKELFYDKVKKYLKK